MVDSNSQHLVQFHGCKALKEDVVMKLLFVDMVVKPIYVKRARNKVVDIINVFYQTECRSCCCFQMFVWSKRWNIN